MDQKTGKSNNSSEFTLQNWLPATFKHVQDILYIASVTLESFRVMWHRRGNHKMVIFNHARDYCNPSADRQRFEPKALMTYLACLFVSIHGVIDGGELHLPNLFHDVLQQEYSECTWQGELHAQIAWHSITQCLSDISHGRYRALMHKSWGYLQIVWLTTILWNRGFGQSSQQPAMAFPRQKFNAFAVTKSAGFNTFVVYLLLPNWPPQR